MMAKIEDLKFVKLRIPKLIPENLIESVKGRTFTIDQFYDYQARQIDNPYNHLYVLVDDQSVIHGYLWAEQNLLDGSLFVNTFSIDKKYWGKGEAMSTAIGFVEELKNRLNSSRVFWCTVNDKFFAKHGFKRSKIILMEYIDGTK